MRHINLLLALGLSGVFSLAWQSQCEAQFITYSSSPTVVTAQSGGGFTAYAGPTGYYYPWHHRHHWRHHSHGFVRDVLVPGAVQLLNQPPAGTGQPSDGNANAEPPFEWTVPQATFREQETAACKNAQGTLAVLVGLRQHFPEFAFKSADKCDCAAPPIDVLVPPANGGEPGDVELPPGVQP